MKFTTDVTYTAWRLHLKDDRSDKFYNVFAGSDGTVILNFGRRGTSGQHKVEQFTAEEAKHVALRQVYAKASKGYKVDLDAVEFAVEQDTATMVQRYPARGVQLIDRALTTHMGTETFRRQQRLVTAHYDKFIGQANEILTARQKGQDFEALLEDWKKLQESWAELDDKHQHAATVVQLVQQTVAQALMGAPA